MAPENNAEEERAVNSQLPLVSKSVTPMQALFSGPWLLELRK